MGAARVAVGFVVLAAAALVSGHSHAQGAWPARPVTLLVPFAAGSGTDTVARVLGQKLSERLGQPVPVDNRPGANAQIGAEAVARAPADGHMLLMATSTTHSSNPALFKALRYDPVRDAWTPLRGSRRRHERRRLGTRTPPAPRGR